MTVWNIKYGSYLESDDFEDLHIEYKQRLFTKPPIDRSFNNILETLKVSPIELLYDNRISESNPQHSDFDDLPFDGDEGLLARRQLYRVDYHIICRLINGSTIYVKSNIM